MAYRARTSREKVVPIWAKEAKKKLEALGMTQKELAGRIGCNHSELCGVLNGLRYSQSIEARVCEELNIER